MSKDLPPGTILSIPVTRRARIKHFSSFKKDVYRPLLSAVLGGIGYACGSAISAPNHILPPGSLFTSFILALIILTTILTINFTYKVKTVLLESSVWAASGSPLAEIRNTFVGTHGNVSLARLSEKPKILKSALWLPFREQRIPLQSFEVDAVSQTPKNSQGLFIPPMDNSRPGMHRVEESLVCRPGGVFIEQKTSVTSLGLWNSEMLLPAHGVSGSEKNSA